MNLLIPFFSTRTRDPSTEIVNEWLPLIEEEEYDDCRYCEKNDQNQIEEFSHFLRSK